MENKIMDITSKERLLLKQIRKRTPMYVGEYSLNKLGDFFEGYREALFNLIKEVPPTSMLQRHKWGWGLACFSGSISSH